MSDGAADVRVSDEDRERAVAERRGELHKRIAQEAGGGVIVFAVSTGIWAASGATGSFWPIWIALVCLLPVLRSAWLLYGPAPDFERVEQDLARYRQWNDRHQTLLRKDARRRSR